MNSSSPGLCSLLFSGGKHRIRTALLRDSLLDRFSYLRLSRKADWADAHHLTRLLPLFFPACHDALLGSSSDSAGNTVHPQRTLGIHLLRLAHSTKLYYAIFSNNLPL